MGAIVETSDFRVISLELELLKFSFSKIRIVPLGSMKLRLQVWVKWLKRGPGRIGERWAGPAITVSPAWASMITEI